MPRAPPPVVAIPRGRTYDPRGSNAAEPASSRTRAAITLDLIAADDAVAAELLHQVTADRDRAAEFVHQVAGDRAAAGGLRSLAMNVTPVQPSPSSPTARSRPDT